MTVNNYFLSSIGQRGAFWCRAAAVCLGLGLMTVSCVDDRYDLDGGISGDVSLPGNKLTFPLGDLRPIMLDSLFSTSGDKFVVEDGVYGFHVSDAISPISMSLEVDPLHVDPVTKDIPFEFGNATIDDIVVEAVEQSFEIDLGSVTMDEINEGLPEIKKDETYYISEASLGKFLDIVRASGKSQMDVSDFKATISSGAEKIQCNFACTLPKRIRNIHDITFCDKNAQGDEANGALVTVNLSFGQAIANLSKTVDLQFVFPEGYELSLDPTVKQAEKYSLAKGELGYYNILKIKSFSYKSAADVISFYVAGIKDLSKYVKVTNLMSLVAFNDDITYTCDCALEGDITLAASATVNDMSMRVVTNGKISASDASVELNNLDCSFETRNIEMAPSIGGLQDIDYVGRVTFEEGTNHLKFGVRLSQPLIGFTMDAAKPIVVTFPKSFVMEPVGNIAGWDAQSNVLRLSSIEQTNDTYEFVVKALDVNDKVIDGKLPIDATVSVAADGGNLKLVGGMASLRELLDGMGERTFIMTTDQTTLVVKDADVKTSRVEKTLDEEFALNMDVPVDSRITAVSTLWPEADVDVTLAVCVDGFKGKDAPLDVVVKLDIPAYMCLASDDPQVVVDGNKLTVTASLDPDAGYTLEKHLRLTHFDFTSLPGGCLQTEKVDGETRLKLSSVLPVKCDVVADNVALTLAEMQDDLSLHASMGIADIPLRMFKGKISSKFDPLATDVNLIGNSLLNSIFSDEASIVFTDPQLKFDVTNSVGVPIDVCLEVETFDADGQLLRGCLQDVTIDGATLDVSTGALTPTLTSIVLTTNPSVVVSGCKMVVMKDLTDMLKMSPASLRLTLYPTVSDSADAILDLSQPLQLDASWMLSLPLQFDEVRLSWKSDPNLLKLSLGDYSKNLSNAAIRLKADIRNTLPFDLSIRFIPTDADGADLKNVAFDPITVAAGNGGTISAAVQPNPISIGVSSTDCDFSAMTGLRVEADVKADHTSGGIALRPEQGILLSDVVFLIEADLEMNFNDSGNN